MKKIIMILMIAIGASSIAFGQMKKAKDTNNSVETQITALEKQAWNEWKNENRKFVENYIADDAFYVYPDGVIKKAQIIEGVGSCKFNSYSLDDFKFQMLDKNSALVSYTAKQDIICNGKPAPSLIRSSSVYVKKGGKWLSTFYTETEVTPDNSSVESQVIALEKASWTAWQKKDGSWFQNNLADDWLLVNSFEVETKKEIVEGIMSDCEVKSFSHDNFRFVMLTEDSARITYTATQDAACEGNTLPKTVRSTAVYVKRGGKWLQSLYMETPLIK